MTERQNLEKLKELMRETNTSVEASEVEILEKNNLKKRWITYFRNNPEIYIEKRMGFHSFGYQNFSYHLMQQASQYIEVSTRGTGKSLRVVVFACFRALLYPGSKIGVTAVGASQANENFLTAFMQEIVYKYSPFMKWLWDNKYITSKETDKGYTAQFWNGSIIYFFPAINSSRGLHCDMIIGEELRLIKKSDWDSIVMPMLVKRRAGFRSLPEYQDRNDLDEETRVLCITSNHTATDWFNTMYRNTFTNYFKNSTSENRVFSVDIFPAIRHGLKSPAWFKQQKEEMDEFSFRTEILNETVGSAERAYFSWELFRKNQVLRNAWYPPTIEDVKSGKNKNRPKQEDERRIIFVDFAWAGDHGTVVNDQTVIGCMSLIPKNDKMYRNVEHIETYSGSKASSIPMRIKEIFFDYRADYIVIDQRSAGEILFNQLTVPSEHPMRGEQNWNPHGLTVAMDKDLHMITDSKLADLRERTVDPEAIPCIIPVIASSTWNSNMWLDLNNRLRNDDISFLIDELEFKTWFEGQKEWFKLTSEEKTLKILPYTQTMLLINEAVNLTAEWREGQIRLSEPRNGMKDRIVAVSYANAIATKIENKIAKNAQQTEFDINDWQIVF